MDITKKIDSMFEASVTARFKQMKQLKADMDSFDELKDALDKEINDRTRFDDLERITFLEHYTVRAIRNLKSLESKLNAFQKSLKQKIDFLKKDK